MHDMPCAESCQARLELQQELLQHAETVAKSRAVATVRTLSLGLLGKPWDTHGKTMGKLWENGISLIFFGKPG